MNRRTLIVYYSWSGHTKQLAERIQQMITGSDLEEITVPANTFSEDMNQTFDISNEQIENNKLPKISPTFKNINDYDIVLVGGPVWGNSPSSPVRSFLNYIQDFSGKVAPFYTDAGTFDQYEPDFKKLSGKLNVVSGLEGNADIKQWLNDFA